MEHSTLGKIMMKEAGFEGHYTNHSLRVTSATRLFDAEVDGQLIMTRTSHSSTDGVRAYKRTSDKLRQLTSDVLNSGKQNVTPAITTFQITGGTNITINIKIPVLLDWTSSVVYTCFVCSVLFTTCYNDHLSCLV